MGLRVVLVEVLLMQHGLEVEALEMDRLHVISILETGVPDGGLVVPVKLRLALAVRSSFPGKAQQREERVDGVGLHVVWEQPSEDQLTTCEGVGVQSFDYCRILWLGDSGIDNKDPFNLRRFQQFQSIGTIGCGLDVDSALEYR